MIAPGVQTAGGPSPPGGLPAELTSFVGRREDVNEVRRLLGVGRLVTLTGIGGVGKTRLAFRVGAAVRRVFANGVCVIDLSVLRDPSLVPNVAVAALGLDSSGGRDPLEVLTGYLLGKQALLIVDNCEHLAEAAAELVAALLSRLPQLRILATSRHALKVPGEQLYPLAPLDVPPIDALLDPASAPSYPAIALFADRAAAVVPGFRLSEKNLPAVVELCRALDGVPLAIELAAVRLRVLSPADMVARLTQRLQVLDGVSQGRPARHQTLRAMIDASYELCTPAEQRLWARASVFAGGFDLAAAERVCSDDSLPRSGLLDALAGLVDKSILVREEAPDALRFRFLEVLREFGQELLREQGDEIVIRRRHRDWCESVVDDACQRWFGPDQQTLLANLRSELANIRVAVEFSLGQPGEARTALHLVGRPWFLWMILIAEGRQWLDRVLAADEAPSDERARALATRAHVASLQGDADAASRSLAEALEIAERVDDPAVAAYAEQFRAMSIALLQPSQALQLLQAAPPLDTASATQDAGTAIAARLSLAPAVLARGDIRTSVEHLERCAELCEAAGERWLCAYAHWGLAFAALARADDAEALRFARQSLAACTSFQTASGQALGLDLLSWIDAAAGRAERAAVLMGAASRLWRTFGRDLFGTPEWLAQRERAIDAAHRLLGSAAFAAAFERGRRFSLEETIAFALDEQRESATTSASANLGLTRREQEVASLVAEGLSNKQISQRLVISQRTAEGHVEHILMKLGFTSRAQIARWAGKDLDTE
jgi:predicted ATPase/DNA-binding CsgD family transcriptional regulator